jgi:hypothetical protein
MTTRWTRLLAATSAIAVAFGSAACSHAVKEKPVVTKSESEAVSLLKTYGDQTAAAIGVPLADWSTVPAPCEGADGVLATDGRFDVTGNAQITLPEDQHVATLQKLRELWQSQGFEVTDDRTFAPDHKRGTVSVRNPADGISVSIQSTGPGTAFALLIATPCYKPVAGEHPGQ